MVPYELVLRNFMCYRGELPELRLDGLHVACLTGENGSGKSALLDAITWALWGKARMSADDLVAQGEQEMLVELRFLLNGQDYRVVRQYRRGKTTRTGRTSPGKTTLDFQTRGSDDQPWRSLSEHTIVETEHKIIDVLRMRYETFINASFLLQGRADEFTSKTPAERKQVLADILDLQEYADLEQRAKNRSKDLKAQIHGIDGAIALLEAEASRVTTYRELEEQAQAKVDNITTRLTTAETTLHELNTHVQQLETGEARRNELRARQTEIERKQRHRQQQNDELQQAIITDEQVLAREPDIAAGVAALQTARETLNQLETLRPRYDELQRRREELKEAFLEARHALQLQFSEYQQKATTLRDQLARREPLQQESAQLKQQLSALDPLVTELDGLRQQRSILDEHISEAHQLSLRHSELQSTIDRQREVLSAQRDEQQRTVTRLQKELRPADRWQVELEEAHLQARTGAELTAQVAEMRAEAQTLAERVTELRTLCEQYRTQAEQLQQRKALLTEAETTTCPLCNSELGTQGITTITQHYDEEIDILRQRYRDSQHELKQLEQNLQQQYERVRRMEKMILRAHEMAARVDTLQQQMAQATIWRTELGAAQTTLQTLEQNLEVRQYARAEIEELLKTEARLLELSETAAQHTSNGPNGPNGKWSSIALGLEQLRQSLVSEQATLEKRLAARTELEHQLTTLRQEAAALEQTAATLPSLEAQETELSRQLAEKDFAHEIVAAGEAVKAALADLAYSPEQHQQASTTVQELSHWTAEQHQLDLARSRLTMNRTLLEQGITLLHHQSAEQASLVAQLKLLDHELQQLVPARQQQRDTQQTVANLQRELQAARNMLTEHQTYRKRAEEANEQLTEKQAERARLLTRQDLFEELSVACGKRGVQAMLIETAIPEIEREANQLLGRITHNQMHLAFDMQRNTKRGETVETLEIRIADALGTRAYNAFSGGEATRINFAIRIALSRLLAARAGASLETLVIDEGMSALDSDGRERFVEAITSIQYDFKRILVITHLDELKDRFPARIEIVKTPSGSRWSLV